MTADSLILIIETSSRPFNIVIGENYQIIFDSLFDKSFNNEPNLYSLTRNGLMATGKSIEQVRKIAVNIGPGGLSSVRSGVAFANGLAFSLKVPICPFLSFELMGFEVFKKYKLPVICSVKAAGGNSYLGLYDRGKVVQMEFGVFESVLPRLTKGLGEFVVAGSPVKSASSIMKNSTIHYSNEVFCQARTFVEMDKILKHSDNASFMPAVPLNEESSVFYECP